MSRPPLPPFTLETATQKVRMAEDAWNTRDRERVSLAYTVNSRWRNRAEFVRFAYEFQDDSDSWRRAYGHENWEFDEDGLMRIRLASINDLPISESQRKSRWPVGPRPADHPGLSNSAFEQPS